MIRIPYDKIYRAFPELDEYTDYQCELLMQRVRIRPASIALIGFGVVAACLAGILAGVYVGSLLNEVVTRFPVSIRLRLGGGSSVVYSYGVPIVLLTAVFGTFARDFGLRRALQKALRLRLERVSCPICRYILIGQQATLGVVMCPECGNRVQLAALGVTPQELAPLRDSPAV